MSCNKGVDLKSLIELDKEAHKYYISEHVRAMIQRKLPGGIQQIITLNEVNKGVVEFGKSLPPNVGMGRGPTMKSSGGSSHGQTEYFPSTYPTQPDTNLKYLGFFEARSDGIIAAGKAGYKAQSTVKWNKNAKKPTFRPIVVHAFEIGGQPIWIGVVHTTPGGDEGHRKYVFSEIEKPLAALIKLANGQKHTTLNPDGQKIPLMVGGDYYLTAEAVTEGRFADLDFSTHGQDQEYQQEKADYEEIKQPRTKRRKGSTAKKAIPPKTAYRAYLRDAIKQAKETAEQLSPDDTWSKTALGQKVTELDFIRNKQNLLISFTNRVEAMGYTVVQSAFATNPKEKDPSFRKSHQVQIADFFMVNAEWQTFRTGILESGSLEILTVDSEELRESDYWWAFSDHLPVILVVSTKQRDPLVDQAFKTDPGATEAANTMNEQTLASKYLRQQYKQLVGKPSSTRAAKLAAQVRKRRYIRQLRDLQHQHGIVDPQAPSVDDLLLLPVSRLGRRVERLQGQLAPNKGAELKQPAYRDYAEEYIAQVLQHAPEQADRVAGGFESFDQQRVRFALLYLRSKAEKRSTLLGTHTMELDDAAGDLQDCATRLKTLIQTIEQALGEQQIDRDSLTICLTEFQAIEQQLIDAEALSATKRVHVFQPLDFEPKSGTSDGTPRASQTDQSRVPIEQGPVTTQHEVPEQLRLFVDHLNEASAEPAALVGVILGNLKEVAAVMHTAPGLLTNHLNTALDALLQFDFFSDLLKLLHGLGVEGVLPATAVSRVANNANVYHNYKYIWSICDCFANIKDGRRYIDQFLGIIYGKEMSIETWTEVVKLSLELLERSLLSKNMVNALLNAAVWHDIDRYPELLQYFIDRGFVTPQKMEQSTSPGEHRPNKPHTHKTATKTLPEHGGHGHSLTTTHTRGEGTTPQASSSTTKTREQLVSELLAGKLQPSSENFTVGQYSITELLTDLDWSKVVFNEQQEQSWLTFVQEKSPVLLYLTTISQEQPGASLLRFYVGQNYAPINALLRGSIGDLTEIFDTGKMRHVEQLGVFKLRQGTFRERLMDIVHELLAYVKITIAYLEKQARCSNIVYRALDLNENQIALLNKGEWYEGGGSGSSLTGAGLVVMIDEQPDARLMQ